MTWQVAHRDRSLPTLLKLNNPDWVRKNQVLDARRNARLYACVFDQTKCACSVRTEFFMHKMQVK
jgi:hypothetical protein